MNDIKALIILHHAAVQIGLHMQLGVLLMEKLHADKSAGLLIMTAA